MLVNTLDCLARIELPTNIIEVFPRNETDGSRFSSFHAKRIPPNVDAVGYPWLKLASGYALTQHSMPLLSAGTTLVSPFWSGSYLTGEEVLMKVVSV